jgi:hypothetical protein
MIEGLMIISITALFLMVALASSTVWAFERQQTQTITVYNVDVNKVTSSKTSDPSMADPCLPLLKTVRHISPVSDAMDRSRRSAGAAATLGLVVGLRFALGPKEVLKNGRKRPSARFDLWQHEPNNTGSLEALAVSEYRRCKNEEALKALSSFRWER